MREMIAVSSFVGLCAALVVCAGLWTQALAEIDVGDRPKLEVEDLDGEEISLADLRGQVVLVDLWATWCSPCRRSMPFYDRLHRDYGQRGFVVLAIAVDEDRQAVKSFRRRHELSFPIGFDHDRKVAEKLGPPSMPTAYLIDRSGVVRYRHVGFRNEDRKGLEEKIDRLLAEPVEGGE